jgi:hypothetical protein
MDNKIHKFHEIVWWLQDLYNWDYINNKGNDKVRFDWGSSSFWLNSDLIGEGDIPFEIKDIIYKKGIIFEQ